MTSLTSIFSSVARYSISLLYMCFLLYSAVAVVKLGFSRHFLEVAVTNGSTTLAQAAIEYQPDDPDVYENCGKLFIEDGKFVEAARAFEQAISLREDDFQLWLELGNSRSRLKDFATAQTAYMKAITLAPSYSRPLAEMGEMLLNAGQRSRGFQFLTRAAELDNKRYPELMRMASAEFSDDPSSIEVALNPRDVKGKIIVTRYLIERRLVTANVRNFLSGNELSRSEKNDFIKQLLEQQDIATAHLVWTSGLGQTTFDSNQPVYDGGFEYLNTDENVGFGWQIDNNVVTTSVDADNKEMHSGSGALQVKFAGNVDFNRSIVSQILKLNPHHKYRLKFFVLSRDLVSAGLPSIFIREERSERTLGQSSSIRSTDGKWMEGNVSFETSDIPFVRLDLRRTDCFTSPCPIFGEILLDDFSILTDQRGI